MLDYVFFDNRPFEQFLAFLRQQGLEPRSRVEEELYEIYLPEDLDEELAESIENFYDEMLDLNQQLFDRAQAAGSDYHAAGVVVTLAAGNTVYAKVDPELLARIMLVLNPREFGDVVNAIVDAVEQPDERTLCQKPKAEKGRA